MYFFFRFLFWIWSHFICQVLRELLFFRFVQDRRRKKKRICAHFLSSSLAIIAVYTEFFFFHFVWIAVDLLLNGNYAKAQELMDFLSNNEINVHMNYQVSHFVCGFCCCRCSFHLSASYFKCNRSENRKWKKIPNNDETAIEQRVWKMVSDHRHGHVFFSLVQPNCVHICVAVRFVCTIFLLN